MNRAFALSLSDIRLLQTSRLLEMTLVDHPDHQLVRQAMDAIRASRAAVKKLLGDIPADGDESDARRYR